MASRRSQPAASAISLRETLIAGGPRPRTCRPARRHAAQASSRSSRAGRFASRARRATKSCSSAPASWPSSRPIRPAAGRSSRCASRAKASSRAPGSPTMASRRSSEAKSWSAGPRISSRSSMPHPELAAFFWRLIQRNERSVTNGWSIAAGGIRPPVSPICCARRPCGCTSTNAPHAQPLHPAADRRHHRPDIGQRQPRDGGHGTPGADHAARAGRSSSPTGPKCAASRASSPTICDNVEPAPMVGAAGIEPATPPV